MAKAIGIDLGTTNTVVAVLVNGRPQVLEDERGYRVLPSVLYLDKKGEEIVGHAARNRTLTEPDRTVYAIKRLMGRRYDSEQATEARSRVGYPVLPGPGGSCLVELAGRRMSPVEVSACILRTARQMAERALGEAVDEAVITVPAYFNHQQRADTMEAARLAGLRCERLVNEPTAAALAYGFRRDLERTLLIYDLGGGTFDVSVLHLSSGVYEILASKGDTYLGGEDFDYRLVDHLAAQFQARTRIDLRKDRMALQRLKEAAERAKCELSFSDRTSVLVPRISGEHSLEATITRLELERLTEDLVQRSMEVTRRAVSEAGLNLSDIDDVILVGGQTRMPRVREMISGLFGREPNRGVHPEEVVAIGAAVHASSMTDDDAPVHVLIDVTPFDLGIDVAGGLFQTVVPRNTHIPATETRTFATSRDDQTSVRITVRQGESRFCDENEFLGEFRMEGLTPAPRMETKVEVSFRLDSSGMLHVSAMEPGVGEVRRITVRNYAEVAQQRGAVKPRVEGDVGSAGNDAAAPPAAAATARKGLLAGLLGIGRKGNKSAARTPTGKAPAEPQAAAPVASASASAATAFPSDMAPVRPTEELEADRRIRIPAPPPPEDLEEFDTAALEAFAEGELVEAGSVASGGGPAAPSAARLGLAGSDTSAWQTEEDAFALPAFDDDEDEDAPVGLASPFEEGRIEELFGEALDEEAPREVTSVQVGADANESADGLFAMDEGDLGSLASDPFRELGDDLLADLGLPVEGERAADAGSRLSPVDGTGDEPFFLPPADDGRRPDPVGVGGQEGADMDDLDFGFAEEPAGTAAGGGGELFALPGVQSERTVGPFDQEERTEIFARSPGPGGHSASTSRHRRRKPARLRLAYRNVEAMVGEYRENLRRGGCFVKTSKPLPVGRECVIEVRGPEMAEPFFISGVVTWSSVGLSTLPSGQDPGMGIEYRLDEIERAEVERVLSELTR